MSELVMDLNSLRKPELLLLCAELGVEAGNAMRKPQIIQALLALEADDSELLECWEIIKERQSHEEKRRADEKERLLLELELKRLELDLQNAKAARVEAYLPVAEAKF